MRELGGIAELRITDYRELGDALEVAESGRGSGIFPRESRTLTMPGTPNARKAPGATLQGGLPCDRCPQVLNVRYSGAQDPGWSGIPPHLDGQQCWQPPRLACTAHPQDRLASGFGLTCRVGAVISRYCLPPERITESGVLPDGENR